MTTGRRGFFGMIAAALGGGVAVATAKTSASFKGLAAKVSPIRWSPTGYGLPRGRNYVSGSPVGVTGTFGGMEFVNGILVSFTAAHVTVNVQTMDAKSISDNSQLIADAVTKALCEGRSPGLQETLRTL